MTQERKNAIVDDIMALLIQLTDVIVWTPMIQRKVRIHLSSTLRIRDFSDNTGRK